MTQNMMIRIPANCLSTVLLALRAAGFEDEAKKVEEFTHEYIDPAANANRVMWVERAREQHGKDGEIEFDDDSTISLSEDNGEYVLGWVWVDGDEQEEDLPTCDVCEEECKPEDLKLFDNRNRQYALCPKCIAEETENEGSEQ